MANQLILEISVYSVTSALAAQQGGADRVELCDNRPEGGTTPSYATIAKARDVLDIPLYPIIRPRGGDFLYDEMEYEVMWKDIEICKKLGCEGIVTGILTSDGRVDVQRCRQLVEWASPMGVTFHRAFDMTADPFEALEGIIDTGCERILSSGQRSTVVEGAALLAELVAKAGERIIIMPGAGIQPNNIAGLVKQTKAKEYHTAAKSVVPSKMHYRNPLATMGSDGREFELIVTDAALVRSTREQAEAAWQEVAGTDKK